MTSIRQSCVWAFEDEFGEGRGSGEQWRACPPGTYISTSHNRSVSKVTAEGNKFLETYSFGTVSGSFSWSFTMDYDYMDPFLLAFEDYNVSSNGDGTYTHEFAKVNNERVPSFCIRRKILNRITGGSKDELTELYGCVVKSISWSAAAGSSAVTVSVSGLYANEKMYTGDLSATDYTAYDGDLVEFQCLFVDTLDEDGYVANTDSVGISVDNSASFIYTTCTPFAAEYTEGQTSFQFSTSCYSNDPDRYKRRVYTGGATLADAPLSKNLAPVPLMYVASYNLSMNDDGFSTVSAAISGSEKTAVFTLTDTVIRSLTWQKGDNSKLQDSISSTECRAITLTVKNDQGSLLTTPPHPVTSEPTTI